jgi:hypothetical protein
MIRADDPAVCAAPGWWLADPQPEAWRPIHLPAAWQTVLGEGFHGTAWLRRIVEVPQDLPRGPDRRLWLRFESVATDLTAWIDGVPVGRHRGDWVPFQLELTGAVGTRGAAEMVLRIDEVRAAPPAAAGALQNGHITKGFHDVLSLQHGGVWQPLRLASSGALCAIPDGVRVRPCRESGEVRVGVELEPRPAGAAGHVEARIVDPDGCAAAAGSVPVGARQRRAEVSLRVGTPRPWSPRDPALYRAHVTLRDDHGVSEQHAVRFGFRELAARGRTILLNGEPVFLRGVLHWGHEPAHIAPAPTPAEIRDQFRRLRALGFNCVCLCMWYPPRHFHEIADETGMLLWQIHPVWQSRMEPEDRQEYRRLYSAFMRRDGNHPSVAVVSATCEHPCFDAEIAAWWWETARRELPGALLEVQSAFFKWSDHRRSDLYDEHTYESSDRWVCYLRDVEAHLRDLPPKPFVMGETVAFSDWPDVAALRGQGSGTARWWTPRCLEDMARLEGHWTGRHGVATVGRFRRQARRHALLGRKFQLEQFRRYPGNAGLIMNHLRDVPACQCGLIDDLGRWRFEPRECRGWLSDAAILLATPQERRGFTGGGPVDCRIVISNFSAGAFAGPVRVRLEHPGGERPLIVESEMLRCEPGALSEAPLRIELPAVTEPLRLRVAADAPGMEENTWDLWVFPEPDPWPRAARRHQGPPLSPQEREPDEVERGYSRGWGLRAVTWQQVPPDPALLTPELPPLPGAEPVPPQTSVVLCSRLTVPIVRWLARGGRVVLLCSKAAGGIPTSYEWLFGQAPLVVEEGPLRPGDGKWIVDLLGYDLTRRHARVIPVQSLGIADSVDPLIRLAYTHDQRESVRILDQLFTARVGAGLLVASSLDHTEDAGRFLLRRIVSWAVNRDAAARGALDVHAVESWTLEAARRAAPGPPCAVA